jgi:selenocysteine lyase/cysteine desulfurase
MTSLKHLFPFLTQNPSIVYLDNASTTHRSSVVMKGVEEYIARSYSSVDGLYASSIESVKLIQDSRNKIANYLTVNSENIVFTHGVTSSLNQLAFGLSDYLQEGSVLFTSIEHHSNLLPWMRLIKKNSLTKIVWKVEQDFSLSLSELEKVEVSELRLVVLNHISNVTGEVVDLHQVCSYLKQKNPKLLIIVDGSQGVGHGEINLQTIPLDAYVFSSHKAYGPTGIGAMYLSNELLSVLEPFEIGGKVVEFATWDGYTLISKPKVFEPGTPNLDGVIGLGLAIDFLTQYKDKLDTSYLVHALIKDLQDIPCVKLYTAKKSTSIVSFVVRGVDSQDLNLYLSQKGVCVRVGSHCAQPLLADLGLESVIRVSFGVYNDLADVQQFLAVLRDGIDFLTTTSR